MIAQRLHDRLCAAASDVLILAVQLPASPHLPPVAELRQQLLTALDAMVGKGRAAGLSDLDLAEARYALVAFIDEQILKSNWVGRAEWMGQPLQLQLYGEYTAGENFFHRLRGLLEAGISPALEIYYLCLALGFRGVYGTSGDQRAIAQFTQTAQQNVLRALPSGTKLGPHAEPADRVAAVRTSNAPLIALIASCALAALLSIGGLYFAVRSNLTRALDAMSAPSATSAR